MHDGGSEELVVEGVRRDQEEDAEGDAETRGAIDDLGARRPGTCRDRGDHEDEYCHHEEDR